MTYSVYIVSDERFAKHKTTLGHPESTDRFFVIDNLLLETGLKNPSLTLTPRLATQEELLLCHTPDYVNSLFKLSQTIKGSTEVFQLPTGDTCLSSGTLEAALLGVGGALEAIDAIVENRAKRVFCNMRPPGHHATSSRGMGFCVFNPAAIAARYAQSKYGIDRVLIVDWDVHHGNGTEEIFYKDPSVFYFSTHQQGIYPGTGKASDRGAAEGIGTTLNVPIQPTAQARLDVINAFKNTLSTAMETFQPKLILISAGFDAHREDPLGGLNLTAEDFAELTYLMSELSVRYTEGKLISLLEGGYNLQALMASVYAHIKALQGSS